MEVFVALETNVGYEGDIVAKSLIGIITAKRFIKL